MDAVTIKNAKENLEHLVDQVISDVNPMIICGDNMQKVVLMPLDEFDSWKETLYLLSNPANALHLRQSIAEAQSGKVAERKLVEVCD